jgi:hypothetical protein
VREAINIIWRLSVASELILAARLLLQGLGSVYPALVTGSCIFALQASLLILSVHHSYSRSPMGDVWKISEPLVGLLWSWIVLELFSKWTKSYPGIGRFGRYLFVALVAIALMVSLICWPFEWKALVVAHDFRIYFILNRVLLATLALFMFLVWLFFRNYPAPVAPNVARHTHITTIYLAVTALSWLAITLSGLKIVAVANLSLVVAAVGCFSAWAILLTRAGEERESIPVMPAEDIARIERVNRELLGLMKNFPREIRAGKFS